MITSALPFKIYKKQINQSLASAGSIFCIAVALSRTWTKLLGIKINDHSMKDYYNCHTKGINGKYIAAIRSFTWGSWNLRSYSWRYNWSLSVKIACARVNLYFHIIMFKQPWFACLVLELLYFRPPRPAINPQGSDSCYLKISNE